MKLDRKQEVNGSMDHESIFPWDFTGADDAACRMLMAGISAEDVIRITGLTPDVVRSLIPPIS